MAREIEVSSSLVTDILLVLFFLPKALLIGEYSHWFLAETIVAVVGMLCVRFSKSPIIRAAGVAAIGIAILKGDRNFSWRLPFRYFGWHRFVNLLNFLGIIFLPLALVTPDGTAWLEHVYELSPIKFTRRSTETHRVSLS